MTFRWSSTGALTNQVIGADDISRTLMMAATTVLGYSMFASVRIRNIKIWGTSAAIGTSATVMLEYGGTASLTATKSVSDTCLSPFEYAHVAMKPPKGSQAWFWIDCATATTTQMFIFTMPANAVLDLELDFVLNATEPAGITRTLAAATVGTVYVPNLGATTLTAVAPFNSIA